MWRRGHVERTKPDSRWFTRVLVPRGSDKSAKTPASEIDSGNAASSFRDNYGVAREWGIEMLLGECARVKQSLAAPEWLEAAPRSDFDLLMRAEGVVRRLIWRF